MRGATVGLGCDRCRDPDGRRVAANSVDNSQYNLTDPEFHQGQYDYLWNFTGQVAYADFLTNMGSVSGLHSVRLDPGSDALVLAQYPLPHPHTTIQTPIQATGPADQKLRPVRCGGAYEWCGLEGTILAMKHVGAVPATGQLEPAIWLGDGCNETTNRTENGWTPAVFKDFLAYLDEEGVRSVAVWTL